MIKELGNLAVHSAKPIRQFDALTAVRELHHFTFWLARTYARGAKPADGLVFDPTALSKETLVPTQTAEQLQKLETDLRDRDEKLSVLLKDKACLDAELVRLRLEIAAAKEARATSM